MKYFILSLSILMFCSCEKSQDNSEGITACTQSLIDSALAKPKGTLIYQIDAYHYNGKTVYLYYAGCCDRYNELKDGNCNYLFSPSGGLTGCGDCSHPNFFTEAELINTIWKDTRP